MSVIVVGLAAIALPVMAHIEPQRPPAAKPSLALTTNAAVPTLAPCPDVRTLVSDGDHVRVDFDSGLIENLTTSTSRRYDPLPDLLRRIIRVGGWRPMVEQRIAGIWA